MLGGLGLYFILPLALMRIRIAICTPVMPSVLFPCMDRLVLGVDYSSVSVGAALALLLSASPLRHLLSGDRFATAPRTAFQTQVQKMWVTLWVIQSF